MQDVHDSQLVALVQGMSKILSSAVVWDALEQDARLAEEANRLLDAADKLLDGVCCLYCGSGEAENADCPHHLLQWPRRLRA